MFLHWLGNSPSCSLGNSHLAEGSLPPFSQAHRSSDRYYLRWLTSGGPSPVSVHGQRGTSWPHLQVPPHLIPSAGRLKGTSSSLCVSWAPMFLPNWPSSFQKYDPFLLCLLPQPDYDVWIDPLQQRTAWAISQLATRRYRANCRRARAEWPDSGSSCSSAPVCAICLEEFSEGQVRQGSSFTSMTRLGREAGAWGRRHIRLVWVRRLHLCSVYPAWRRGRGQL